MNVINLLQSTCRVYPDLPIVSVTYNGDGQYNDVLVINDEFIFRFPKYLEALEHLQTEAAILTGIQDYISLEVPLPVFVSIEGQAIGEAFVGYRRIAGEPLWRETFQAVDDEKILDKLAVQLATFLKELHSVPVDIAIECELPVSDTYEECADIYARIREKLFTYMRLDARRRTMHHFEAFLSNRNNFEYEPVLRHGDFGPSNILFDRQRQAIRGVIDFGGSGLGDPAYDLAGLLSGYGETFIRRCYRAYPEVETFMDRVRFYQGSFALLEALFGAENNDQKAFESGIEQYR